METKEELINNIKDWISLNNEIKQLQNEIKKRKIIKKEKTNELVKTMTNNDIDCFNLEGEKLIYTKNKIKKPLSKKHLESSLEDFFKNDDDIPIQELISFILNSRDIKITEEIRHKIIKT